jgi:DNA repair ATPase RecN
LNEGKTMIVALEAMKRQKQESTEKARQEFFTLITKTKVSDRDVTRLRELCNLLGWDEDLIGVISQVLERVEQIEKELAAPGGPTEESRAKLAAELTTLQRDWEEKNKEFQSRYTALMFQLNSSADAITHRSQLANELESVKSKFSPLFGTGDQWGRLDDSVSGVLYTGLKFLREHDPAHAMPRPSAPPNPEQPSQWFPSVRDGGEEI